MALPITIPYTFAGATGTAQLSQLDADIALLAATINGIGNGSVALANVQITGGSLSNIPIGISAGGTGLTTAPSTGQILIGNGAVYQLSNLTNGTGITITNSGGNVTISATGNATANSVTVGTTGIVSGNSGAVLSVSGNTLAQILPGTTGNVMTSNGTAWVSVVGGSASNITVGTTGVNSSNSGAVLVASGNVLAQVIPGTLGNVLTSNGSAWLSQAGGGGSGLTNIYQPSAFTSAAVQTAINTAFTAGGGIVTCPAGTYNCTSQIEIKTGVVLTGQGKTEYVWGNPGSIAGGTIFQINWGSGTGHSGNTAYAAVLLDPGTRIENIAFDYPSQSSSASSPTEYGSTVMITPGSNGNIDQEVIDCYFFKSYIGVDARGSKTGFSSINLKIIGNRGCPLFYGIAVDYMADWGIIANNDFNSGQINPNALTSGLVAWTMNYGSAYFLGGNDWIQLINCQVFGYAYGAYIAGQSGYAGGGPYTFNSCQFDACFNAIYLSGTINETVKAVNCVFAGYNYSQNAVNPANGWGAALAAGTGVNMANGAIQFVGNYVFGPTNYVCYLSASGQTIANVIISDNFANANSGSGSPYNAVVASNGSGIQVINNIFKNYAGVASLGSATSTQVAYNNGSGGSGASGLTVGSSSISGGTSGRILIDSSGVLQELAPGTSGNVVTSSGGVWVSQAPSSGGLTIGSTPISGGYPGELLIVDASGSTLQMTPTFTMSGQIGSIANGGSYWTGASVFGASSSNWGVEATSSSSSYTGNGALIARVNNTGNPFAAFYYTTSNYGSITVSGGGTSYNTSSDYRLKENIQTASGGLSAVQAMRPVTYTWKAHPELGADYGFIAHELQAVAPQAVKGDKDAVNDDGTIKPQQVDYSRVVPYLVAAIQELSAQVKDLQAKLPTT